MSTMKSRAGTPGQGRRRQELRPQPAHMNRQHRVSQAGSTNTHQRVQESSWEPSSPPGPDEILVRVHAYDPNHIDHSPGTGIMSPPSAPGSTLSCDLDAAGTVIAAGDRGHRFAVGDEVFGHFPARSWAWVQTPWARTTADAPHVEHRPEGLNPLAAAALAHDGLTATTILRAAELRPGQTALVIGTTARTGTVLVPLLAEAGAHVIAGATPEDDEYVRSLGAADTIHYTTAHPVSDALAAHPDVDLCIDLVSFGEPYFITTAARHGTIVSSLPHVGGPGVPRIPIVAEPGDLAALAQRALDARRPGELARVYRLARGRVGAAGTGADATAVSGGGTPRPGT
jgi:NADPH2:quinone reductase